MEWGEYRFDNESLFSLCPVKNKLSKSDLDDNGKVPVYSSESTNNWIIGYTQIQPDFIVNSENPVYVVFGDHTRSFNIATESFCVADNVKVLSINKKISIRSLLYIVSSWKKNIPEKWYARHRSIAQEVLFNLPTCNGEIDFAFMENFVAEIEAERMAQLDAYLSATGLKDCILTEEEERVLEDFERGKVERKIFNLEQLFWKATRGKRLKSDDRIAGDLSFVTAWEADTWISAFIGNDVEVFSANTTTIDMFWSAKYRNYQYGWDDHVAVVHTANLPKFASIFVTTAIHKTSYNGQFHYGRNFYAKDADELDISLPTLSNSEYPWGCNNQPHYDLMQTLISAIQKLVIRDVVVYADRRIEATKIVTNQ